jgi:SAM-dependent methyltransferase
MSFPFENFDASKIPPMNVVEGYGLWSKNYDDMLTDNLDGPILDGFLPHLSVEALDIVDLGCGTGRTGAWMRKNLEVRSIDGVDLCEDMLAHAESKGVYDSAKFGDMADTGLASCSYDLAANVLSACHMADLGSLYREAFRLLRPGGVFLLIDYHPHMLLCGMGTCFPDVEGNRIAIENHVHLLRDHARIAGKTGFQCAGFDESLITQEWLDQGLPKKDFLNHPIGFGYLWRKGVPE